MVLVNLPVLLDLSISHAIGLSDYTGSIGSIPGWMAPLHPGERMNYNWAQCPAIKKICNSIDGSCGPIRHKIGLIKGIDPIGMKQNGLTESIGPMNPFSRCSREPIEHFIWWSYLIAIWPRGYVTLSSFVGPNGFLYISD